MRVTVVDQFNSDKTWTTKVIDVQNEFEFTVAMKQYNLVPLGYVVVDFNLWDLKDVDAIKAEFKKYKSFVCALGTFQNMDYSIRVVLPVSNDPRTYKDFILSVLSFLNIKTFKIFTSGFTPKLKSVKLLQSINTDNEIPSLFVQNDERYKKSLSEVALKYLKENKYLIEEVYDDTIIVSKNEVQYFWFISEPKYLSTKGKKIKIDLGDISQYKEKIVPKEILSKLATPIKEISLNVKHLNISMIDAEVQRFIKSTDNILCIKSPMGTNKGFVLRRLIKKFDKVLIISSRKALSKQWVETLNVPVFEEEPLDSCICQFEKLKDINVTKYDCIIIDEWETLLSHVCNSSLQVESFIKLIVSIKQKVVVIDAFLTKSSLNVFEGRDITFVENFFRQDKIINKHESIESLKDLVVSLRNRKTSVSCVSKSYAKELCRVLGMHNKKAMVITSELSGYEKIVVLEKFKRNIIDVLIFSPALSIGVDILSAADKHFHIDNGVTVSPIQSIQMMGRVRGIRSIDYFVRDRENGFTISGSKVLMSQKQSEFLVSNVYRKTPLCSYDEQGNCTLNSYGKIFSKMFIHNSRIFQSGTLDFLFLQNFLRIHNIKESHNSLRVNKNKVLNEQRNFKERSEVYVENLKAGEYTLSPEVHNDLIHLQYLQHLKEDKFTNAGKQKSMHRLGFKHRKGVVSNKHKKRD